MHSETWACLEKQQKLQRCLCQISHTKKIFSCVCYQFLSSLEKNKQHTKVPFYNLIFFFLFSPLKLSGKPFLSVINWINRLTVSPCWFWHVSLYWVKNNWSHWYIVLLYVFLRMWIHPMFTFHIYSVLPIYNIWTQQWWQYYLG